MSSVFVSAAPALRPDASLALRRVFVRGLEVQASLGVLEREHRERQRVVIHIELLVEDDAVAVGVGEDRFSRVVDYGRITQRARDTALAGHTRLAETLAERIAVLSLEDPRVVLVQVTVEKPDVLTEAAAVGVTVERRRPAR